METTRKGKKDGVHTFANSRLHTKPTATKHHEDDKRDRLDNDGKINQTQVQSSSTFKPPSKATQDDQITYRM